MSAPPFSPHPPLAVRADRLVKRFRAGGPEEIAALAGVTLSIAPGEYLSIEGPSGGGKTTLLNLLGLLEVPTEGEIFFAEAPMGHRKEHERARMRLTGVGFIFQRFFLIPTMTARENVELPLRALGRPRREQRERAELLLDQVGLARRRESFPHELSGGEEQRVAVARALANRPGLLLADEPTGELDRANGEAVLDLMETVQRATGATLVVVTHDPKVAARARRHVTLEDGRIVSDSASE
ncbi:MAG: ABC transporter ATP-binding protein [Thermoplasmata archaeon]